MTKIETLGPAVATEEEQMPREDVSPIGQKMALGDIAVGAAVAVRFKLYSLAPSESGLSIAGAVEHQTQYPDIAGTVTAVAEQSPFMHVHPFNEEPHGPTHIVRAGLHVVTDQVYRGALGPPKLVPRSVIETSIYPLD